MQRFSPSQIDHFIEFVLSPIVSVDLPFGERFYKLSTGEKVVVPNMIRNMIHSRIIAQYKDYCKSTINGEFIPINETILFAILRQCPAAIRKSLSGLDNISADGSVAFDEITSICDQLLSFGKFPIGMIALYNVVRINFRCTIRTDYNDKETPSPITKLSQACL
jgi:hypothetical protein